MTLTRSLLISIGTIMLLAAVILAGYTYQGVKGDAYQHLYRESEAIYNFLMSVRRVYQKQFLESGIPLNDKTVGFLPAHSLPRISQEFSEHWDQRGIQIRTASDRPRNEKNQADAGELEAISWFQEDDERPVFIKEETENFLYVRPVWVVKSCLKCHGDPQSAPPTIRERYQGAFGYEVGDLRGVVSVRIPMERVESVVMDNFIPRFIVLLGAFLLITLAVYVVVRRLIQRPVSEMVEGVRKISDHSQSSHLSMQSGELGEFVDHFNQMMDRQQQLHMALTEQKEKTEQILESMEEGVVVTDAAGRILHLNHRLEEWCGWPSVTHYGAPVESLFEREWSLRQSVERGSSLKLRCSDEGAIPVHASIGILGAEEQGVEGEVWVLHDLREQLRAEKQEEFAAYQAGVAEMSTMILHNVGNALAAIDGGVLRLKNQMAILKQLDKLFDRKLQLLSEAEQAFPDVTSAASKLEELRRIIEKGNHEVFMPLLSEMEMDGLVPIEHSVRHISEIIRAQQGSAKIATHASSFRLQDVLQDALIMQQDMLDKMDVELIERRESELFDVQLPKNQMIQALNNLIKNSYESIAERMREQPGHRGKIELILSQSQKMSTLVVKDNGVGVAAEQQSEIFGFGYTSKERGSGFGLHATTNFIHGLGGSVILQSDGVGHGASVTLTVPNQVEDELLQSLKKV